MDLDGTLFGTVVTNGVTQPFMLVANTPRWIERVGRGRPQFDPNGDQDRIHEEMFFAASPRASWLTVNNLNHMSFADEAYFFNWQLRLAELVGARVPVDRTHEIASRYVRTFFWRYLIGTDRPWDALRRTPYPGTHLRIHSESRP